MKRVKSLIFLFVSASLLLSLTHGAAYMKIDGIKGESKDSKHKDWIDILSVSGLPTRDAASGMASGKRQHKPFTITKRVDKASPLFADKGTSGNNPLYQGKMQIEQDGAVFELTGVKVEKVEKKGNNEIVTLSYSGIKAKHDVAMNSIRNMKAAADNSGSSAPARATKAQDYNSSRSNNESSDK